MVHNNIGGCDPAIAGSIGNAQAHLDSIIFGGLIKGELEDRPLLGIGSIADFPLIADDVLTIAAGAVGTGEGDALIHQGFAR